MIQDLPIVFVIPFRSGSKGLENKNIKQLNGLPLYLHTVNQACLFDDDSLIYITTDYTSNDLPDIPNRVIHIIRGKRLCEDNTLMSDVVYDFISQNVIEESIVVLLQVTSPLRTISDIQKSINLFQTCKFDLVMTVCETNNSVLKYGTVSGESFRPIHKPRSCFENRQNLPKLYRPNGMVYVFNSSWFKSNRGFATESLGIVEVSSERSIDIDTVSDCKIAENYLKNLN